jgi:hypothetical protein
LFGTPCSLPLALPLWFGSNGILSILLFVVFMFRNLLFFAMAFAPFGIRNQSGSICL